MQMTLGEAGGALVIELRETRLDAAVAIRFKDAIRSATAHPGSPVILDLGKVEFMDSSGLGAIVGGHEAAWPGTPVGNCSLVARCAQGVPTDTDGHSLSHSRPRARCASPSRRRVNGKATYPPEVPRPELETTDDPKRSNASAGFDLLLHQLFCKMSASCLCGPTHSCAAMAHRPPGLKI